MRDLVARREQLFQPTDPPTKLAVVDPQCAGSVADLFRRLQARAGQLINVILDQASAWVGRYKVAGDHLRVGGFGRTESLGCERLKFVVRLAALLKQVMSVSRISCFSVASRPAPVKTMAARRRSSSWE